VHALKVLEFGEIRAALSRHAETALGIELAAEIHPSFDVAEVTEQLAATAEAYAALGEASVPPLYRARDLRASFKRASKKGVLGGLELYQIAEALLTMRTLRSFLINRAEDYPRLHRWVPALFEEERLEGLLLAVIESDGSLRDDASPALSQARQRKKAAAARIQDRIQQYLSGKTRELLSDPIYTIRDGRYVIPLKAENRGKIRGIVHDVSASGQTIFLEPEDILQMGNALREAEAAEKTEEMRLLTVYSERVGTVADPAIGSLEATAAIDVVFAKARYGYEIKGCHPLLVPGPSKIEVNHGFHPLLNREIAVPLDIQVSAGASVLITGPNTGGKTVAIKAVGLFMLMAQSGLMLPAHEVKISPFTQIWADIGDEQSLQQSLSTFSGHLKNIADALRWMKPGALVLLDELGAGTDPAEGAALAVSILREMDRRGAVILASTHYGELKAFAYEDPHFTNAAMEFDAKTLKPTYRLLMGSPGASQALRIAERYGIPKEIVDQARLEIGTQARDIARMLEQLEASQKQARIAQGEADRRTEELRRSEQRSAKKLAEADEIRRTAHLKANEVIEAALREIRLEADRLFTELRRDGTEQTRSKVRRGLRDLDEAGRGLAQEFAPVSPRATVPSGLTFRKGDPVKIQGYTQAGIVAEEPKGGKATVQVGPLRLTVALSSLEPAAAPRLKSRPAQSGQLQKAMTAGTEIQLISQRAEEAQRELEKFVDDSILGGVPSIRIVHGKGQGILRNVVQDYLRRHPQVREFRDGEPAEGGAGVTIATFG
jgi:DNA mismatch repair protein MutS2